MVLLTLVVALGIAELAPAAAPASQAPADEYSHSTINVGTRHPGPAEAHRLDTAPAPGAPGLQVVAGTVAPETGVRFDSSGRVHYSGSDAASMATERHGDTVVTTIVPRH